MNKLKTIGLITIVLSFISCQSAKLFYFNNKVIPETRVYEFVNEDDENDVIYWEMCYKTNDTLVTNTYDSKLVLQNEFIEVLEKSNSKLIKYTSYYEFHDQPVRANISKNKVFNLSNNDPIEYKIDFKVAQDEIAISKQREYLSTESVNYKGTLVDTKKFKDTYLITVNSIEQESTHSVIYYAKGIGVIQFNSYAQGRVSKMNLNKIFIKEEFKELKAYH